MYNVQFFISHSNHTSLTFDFYTLADPVIEEALKNAPECSCLITVQIERATWRDKENNFRKSKDLMLKSVPTLVKLGTVSKVIVHLT